MTFELVSLAIVLCSFLSMGLIIIPEEILQYPRSDGQMVKSLTASLVSREEEERHQRNLNENEQLKNQIAEIEYRVKEPKHKLQEKPVNVNYHMHDSLFRPQHQYNKNTCCCCC
ncbi:hypothetical protein RRG08_031677 [Elysia crispata]|uniref:Uncharacterized protein n=1 Tax=Elysia crispata TaxID=231223 RepID=A0AAE1EAT7_9GAST|nr:hypothetical protein RRG08_031677 [Elysia crispata]